jgi:hypothetical protein
MPWCFKKQISRFEDIIQGYRSDIGECNFLQYSKSRGVISVSSCLTVKGAEDVLNKQFAFELSTNRDTMYFIADTDKVSTLSILASLCCSVRRARTRVVLSTKFEMF